MTSVSYGIVMLVFRMRCVVVIFEFRSNRQCNCSPLCVYRKTRNLSEKKRRDQFNLLVNELGSMVSASSRKMDKSSVLKSTISYLKQHNGLSCMSMVCTCLRK